MEGTQALIVNPRLTQVNKLADHVNNVGGLHNLIDCSAVNHADKGTNK